MIQQSFKHYVDFSSADLITKRNENLNHSDLLNLYDCCKALKQHKPLQYILGETVFLGSIFKVNSFVLIPRPETEELVEMILKGDWKLRKPCRYWHGERMCPCFIKKNKSNIQVTALDISEEALDVAQQNAKLNSVEINFYKKDILSEKETQSLGSFDIIVSNPPYIAKRRNVDARTCKEF